MDTRSRSRDMEGDRVDYPGQAVRTDSFRETSEVSGFFLGEIRSSPFERRSLSSETSCEIIDLGSL